MTTALTDAIAKMSMQFGTIENRQRTAHGQKMFYGHYYIPIEQDGAIKRLHKRVTLGRVGEMTKTQARDELREKIRAHFRQLGAPPDSQNGNGTKTLREFVENEFYAVREGRWRKESTAPAAKYYISHLLTAFGDRDIRTITKPELQKFIDALHFKHNYSDTLVKHVRTYTKAIFEEASEQSFVDKNPAARLKLPTGLRKPDRYFLPNWKALATVMANVPEDYRLIMRVAASCAMRPAELVALRRRSFDGTRFHVTETYYKGKLRAYGKTDERCNIPVGIPAGLARDIATWLDTHPGTPEDFLFPSSAGTVQNPMNILHRVFRPIRTKLKLPKLNFQVLRRTFATLSASTNGENADDVRRQLGHSEDSNVAERVYIQDRPEQQQALLDDNERKLIEAEKVLF